MPVQTGARVSAGFDEERFAALLNLAGLDTAIELTRRLDEDLTRVDLSLADALAGADRAVLHVQSHILLSIAGTIGATLVYDLAKRLNALVRGTDQAAGSSLIAEISAEIRVALNDVIARVRFTRSELTRSS